MLELFRKFLQLTLLKLTPQELPGHHFALLISVTAAFLLALAGLLFAYSFGDAVFRSLLAILMPAIMVYAMLGTRNLQPRFVQTYTALCGSAAVIYLVALPLMPGFFAVVLGNQSGKFIVILVLLLDLWNLVVTAHILKHSFDVGFATGISLALALLLATFVTIEALAPVAELHQIEVDSFAQMLPVSVDAAGYRTLF